MKVKGTALVSIPKGIEKKFGADNLKNWVSRLSPAAQQIYTSSIMPNEWYPLKEALIEPMALLCQIFYKWDMKGAWEFGRFSAEYALRGVYKIFVRFGSPEFIINKASSILPTYYEGSAIEVAEKGEHSTIVRITAFPDIDKTIEYRIGGWMEAALEICGCKEVKVSITKSLTRFQPCTEYSITWSGK